MVLTFSIMGICVHNEYEGAMVFAQGKFRGVRGPGLTVIVPIFQTKVHIKLLFQSFLQSVL